MALPVRPPAAARRARPVPRATRRLSRARVVAALALMAAAGAFYGLSTSSAFALDHDRLAVEGLHRVERGTVLDALGLGTGASPNLFRIRSTELEAALAGLPPIRSSSVSVGLPDRMDVRVEEREPILLWRQGGRSLLIDVEGMAFGHAAPSDVLPAIEDRRTAPEPVDVGGRVHPDELEVARLLGAVGPDDVASSAPALTVALEDEDGWVVEAPDGWRAIFGHYTVQLRPADGIPQQVACLRGLLAAGEAQVERVVLAVLAERCGTYLPVTSRTPVPAPTPDPSASPPGERP